jgi:hypothetical protein
MTAVAEKPKRRRKYVQGRCDDCARFRNVTEVRFWVNDYRQKYCTDCIKMYRKVILAP